MGRFAAFDADALNREWIAGVSPERFEALAAERAETIRRAGEAARHGAWIAEPEPVAFCAAFAAAARAEAPAILANPGWGATEERQAAGCVRPGVVFGHEPRAPWAAAPGAPPSPGAVLVPTGGTTGGVRFAAHAPETLTAAAEALRAFVGGAALHTLCVLPLFHVSGLMQVVRAAVTGGSVAFPDFRELADGRFPGRPDDRFLSVVPTQLRRLLESGRATEGLRRRRAIFVGGAALPAGMAEAAREAKLPVAPSYGATETAAMAAVCAPAPFLAGDSTAGQPLPGVSVEIVDGDGRRIGARARGRIRVSGPSVCDGYLGGPALPAAGFVTGDIGWRDEAGRLTVEGRADRVINTGGEKVDPAEVERALASLPGVAEALVVGWPDAEWGEAVVAICRPEGAPLGEAALREAARPALAPHQRPKRVAETETLPLNAAGKPDRDAIRRLLGG